MQMFTSRLRFVSGILSLAFGCYVVAVDPPLALAAEHAPTPAAFALRDGQRILFLGDSNTFNGAYIQYLDAYLFTRFPDRKFELINLGLPSRRCPVCRSRIIPIRGRMFMSGLTGRFAKFTRTSSLLATA